MSFWHSVSESIYQSTGKLFSIEKREAIGGGSINEAYRLSDNEDYYFVKVNQSTRLAMFEAEFQGLQEIRSSNSVKAPRPIVVGVAGDKSYLVLEHIHMGGSTSDEAFGEQLAQLHRVTQSQFGWSLNNTIGSTPQINTEMERWPEFWANHRLGYQLKLAKSQGCSAELWELGNVLLSAVPSIFSGYAPQPSLLHGDLWAGNYSTDSEGNPVIYDPACYFGDRETDIAMTELFGGFNSDFYRSYNATWPLDEGYATRKTLYNVYHIINHFNLFGGNYAQQAERMIESLLSVHH